MMNFNNMAEIVVVATAMSIDIAQFSFVVCKLHC